MVNAPVWWLFIAAGPLVYWLLPQAWRAWALSLGSLAALLALAPSALAPMVLLALAVFALHRPEIDRLVPRAAAIARSPAPLAAVLGYLLWAKYLPSLAAAIGGGIFAAAVPLGVSYLSFKLLHYAIEMRRGNFAPHGLADFLSWMFLVPIFSAGPIERFEHFLAHREAAFRFDFVVEGILRIAQGLVKKFVLGLVVLEGLQRVTGGSVLDLLGRLDAVGPGVVWAYLLLALSYIYLDFSAYSDIAIGASRLFGLRIMENFNLPFLAGSLREFWLRWHMTLANWCRGYVYMPVIGLTRNPYLAVIATFMVMGAWHAAIPPNWIVWGLWHGLGIVAALSWTRFAQKRRIKVFRTRLGAGLGWALTIGFVALGGAFTALHGLAPLTDSFRLIAAAFGLRF